jgi:hypothetical protein
MSTETDNAAEAKLIERYLAWLDADIKSQEGYHNHKETMAWSATAAYLGFVLLGLSHEATSYPDSWGLRLIFCVPLLIIAFAAFVFIYMQFDARWIAADRVAAFRRIRTRLSQFRSDQELTQLVLGLAKSDDSQWPQFIEEEVKRSTKTRKSLRVIFRMLMLMEEDPLKSIRHRQQSELASYTVLVVATGIGLASVLFARGNEDLVTRVKVLEEQRQQAIKEVAARVKALEDQRRPQIEARPFAPIPPTAVDRPNPPIKHPDSADR